MSNIHMQQAIDLFAFSSDGTRMPAAHQANAAAMSQAQATLALAYEQHTANLLALAQMEHRNADGIGFHAAYASAAIHERLGLA